MNKQFAVLGLGSFGWSVATTLERLGCDVIVMDQSYERIQEIADKVAYAMRADVSDPEAMQALGGKNLDGAIVAISDNLEASIMATMLSKEMGIPYVVAKAKDRLQGTILEKVGADRIIYPEVEMGSRIAKNLMSTTFSDWIELSSEYSMAETPVPKEWVGKSLVELAVREKCNVNVVGIIENGQMHVTFDPNRPLTEHMILVIIGADEVLENFHA